MSLEVIRAKGVEAAVSDGGLKGNDGREWTEVDLVDGMSLMSLVSFTSLWSLWSLGSHSHWRVPVRFPDTEVGLCEVELAGSLGRSRGLLVRSIRRAEGGALWALSL